MLVKILIFICFNTHLPVPVVLVNSQALNSGIAEVAQLLRARVIEEFSVYVTYVHHLAGALVAFENRCFIDDAFRSAVEECSAHAGDVDLRVLLRRPLDRISQYVSFLETVLTRCTTGGSQFNWASHSGNSMTALHDADVAAIRQCVESIDALQTRMRPW